MVRTDVGQASKINAHVQTASVVAKTIVDMPPEIGEVIQEFRTCEFATLLRDGTRSIDRTSQILHVQGPNGTGIKPGPAGLLCHKHDELLWNATSFHVRGTLEQDSEGWVLRPLRFTHGASNKIIALLKMIRTGRRTTKRYLEKRNLPRPKIPWDEIRKMWSIANRSIRVNADLQSRNVTY